MRTNFDNFKHLDVPGHTNRQLTVVDQERISNSTITLVGGGYLAQLVYLGLNGLGFQNISVISDGASGFLESILNQKKSIDAIEAYSKFMPSNFSIGFNPSDMVIDCSRDLNLRKLIYEKSDSIYISGVATKKGESLIDKISDLEGPENPIVAGVIGGMLLNSVARYFSDKEICDGEFSFEKTRNLETATIIGAGAIGTYVALQAALNGFKNIRLIDFDKIEYTNLNRQMFYYGSNANKAIILSQRLSSLGANFEPIDKKLTEENVHIIGTPEVIFNCVDNNIARRLVNDYAVANNIYLIDGGTNAYSGEFVNFIPGETLPVDQQKDISRDIQASCAYQESSVIMPNMIIGSAMVGAALSGIKEKLVYYSKENILVPEVKNV